MVDRHLQVSIYIDQPWSYDAWGQQTVDRSIKIDQRKLAVGGVDQPSINFD